MIVVHRPQSSVTAHQFEGSIQPHVEALRAIARGIVRSEDLAEDAVQEALLTLWAQATPPQDLRGWLVRTVVHKCLHVMRSRTRRERHEALAGADRPESCPLCDPARLLAESESMIRLDEALRNLSEELRTTFLLRQEEGLDYESIAKTLRVPIGTVRSRLNRAREVLAARLHAEGHFG